MNIQLDITMRPEIRLDAKWLKTDLKRLLYRDGLAELWNEMVRDGEIVGSFSDSLVNTAGIIARKGIKKYSTSIKRWLIKFYFNICR